MERTKEEWQQIIGHNIRNDTYQVLERIQKNEKFEDIIKDIREHREKYGVKQDTPLVRKETVKEYLSLVGVKIQEELVVVEKNVKTKRKSIYDGLDGYGIYGIFIDDELIYIGETIDFKTRAKSHHTLFNNSDKPLYVRMRLEKENGKNVSIKPLINIKDLVTDEKITQRDIFAMELALITLYKPLYNYEGVKILYQFSNKRQEKYNH